MGDSSGVLGGPSGEDLCRQMPDCHCSVPCQPAQQAVCVLSSTLLPLLFFLKSHLPPSQASLPWCFQNLALAQFEAVTPKSSATVGGKGPCDLAGGGAVRGSGARCTPVVWVCSRRRPGEILASLQRAALYLTGSGSRGDSLQEGTGRPPGVEGCHKAMSPKLESHTVSLSDSREQEIILK